MELKVLSKSDLEQIRLWRNQEPATLRTPYMLTQEMQEDYYEKTICNRNSNTRYWGFWISPKAGLRQLIGYGGIENIHWENRNGEISVLIGPEHRRHGYGRLAVELILKRAFNYLNLENVYGECYECSNAIPFWTQIIEKNKAYFTILPNRKYYNGRYWESLYFNFLKEGDKYGKFERQERWRTCH